jgi:hypothetical protein
MNKLAVTVAIRASWIVGAGMPVETVTPTGTHRADVGTRRVASPGEAMARNPLDIATRVVLGFRGGTRSGAAIDDHRRFEALTAHLAPSSPGRARFSR